MCWCSSYIVYFKFHFFLKMGLDYWCSLFKSIHWKSSVWIFCMCEVNTSFKFCVCCTMGTQKQLSTLDRNNGLALVLKTQYLYVN